MNSLRRMARSAIEGARAAFREPVDQDGLADKVELQREVELLQETTGWKKFHKYLSERRESHCNRFIHGTKDDMLECRHRARELDDIISWADYIVDEGRKAQKTLGLREIVEV